MYCGSINGEITSNHPTKNNRYICLIHFMKCASKVCFILRLESIIFLLSIQWLLYLPTFPKFSNACVFCIHVRILWKSSDVFRTLPQMFRRLPNIAEDGPMIYENCRMSRCEARNHDATQTRHLVPFTGLFWMEIEFNFGKNVMLVHI